MENLSTKYYVEYKTIGSWQIIRIESDYFVANYFTSYEEADTFAELVQLYFKVNKKEHPVRIRVVIENIKTVA